MVIYETQRCVVSVKWGRKASKAASEADASLCDWHIACQLGDNRRTPSRWLYGAILIIRICRRTQWKKEAWMQQQNMLMKGTRIR
jgi:hypothetical protein